jgi:hypothetical protein
MDIPTMRSYGRISSDDEGDNNDNNDDEVDNDNGGTACQPCNFPAKVHGSLSNILSDISACAHRDRCFRSILAAEENARQEEQAGR